MIGLNGNHLLEQRSGPSGAIESAFYDVLGCPQAPIHLTDTDGQELILYRLGQLEVLPYPGQPVHKGGLQTLGAQIPRGLPHLCQNPYHRPTVCRRVWCTPFAYSRLGQGPV